MKIGCISDLHIDLLEDYNREALLQGKNAMLTELVEELQLQNIDVLLIAGDISEDYEVTIATVNQLIKLSGKPVYYVPGNHDLWNIKHKNTPTNVIIDAYHNDPNCLWGRSLSLSNDIVLIGHIGWYNYSYSDQSIPADILASGTYKGRTAGDKKHINFGKSDIEMHDEMLNLLTDLIEQNQNKKIILMTHMVNHQNFLVPPDIMEFFKMFNGYLGSSQYETMIKHKRPTYAICGHIHHRTTFTENDVTYICPCLSYKREWTALHKCTDDLRDNIRDALQIIEI